jgi:hypothetical protein
LLEQNAVLCLEVWGLRIRRRRIRERIISYRRRARDRAGEQIGQIEQDGFRLVDFLELFSGSSELDLTFVSLNAFD